MNKKFLQIVRTTAVVCLVFPAANAITCVDVPDPGWPSNSKACDTGITQVGAASINSIDSYICPSACGEASKSYQNYWYIYLVNYETIKTPGLYCACK